MGGVVVALVSRMLYSLDFPLQTTFVHYGLKPLISVK